MARVLVVDDHPDTAHTCALLLRHTGHEARSATGGAEALRIAAEFLPDTALIDVHMLGLDGQAVARGIRALPGLEGTLLVALTGLNPGDPRRAPEGDFDAFLLKPVDLAELDRLLRPPAG
jgi:CheY-like chemotaxis protein